jgi:ACS family sodium-dependent inorganic phosphate cotransporter-like MFS transporter 5
VRKIFNTLGLLLPASAVIGLAFVTCAVPYAGVALLTFGLATTGCGYGAGFMVNYNDVAGSFAGLSFGLANTFGTVPGIIAPYLVGLLTTNQLQSEWRVVFFITAGVYVAGAIGYLILGSGELQPWAAKKAAPQNPEEEIPLREK